MRPLVPCNELRGTVPEELPRGIEWNVAPWQPIKERVGVLQDVGDWIPCEGINDGLIEVVSFLLQPGEGIKPRWCCFQSCIGSGNVDEHTQPQNPAALEQHGRQSISCLWSKLCVTISTKGEFYLYLVLELTEIDRCCVAAADRLMMIAH